MPSVAVLDESTPLMHDDNSDSFTQDERTDSQMENSERHQIESNTPTPLPLRALAIILLLRVMTPLTFEIIFPFINQMILEVGVVDNPEEVGFYSGLIESIFSLLSLVTVMPISYLADYIGRKPVILWGTLAMAISTASFGMSKTLFAMILTRCIGGATGSVWVATKTVMGEYTDKTNQAKVFQLSTVAYRTGQIVGLPLGGILAHPERNFSLFQSTFWIENPFALPCFVAAAAAIVSVILGYFFLEETLKPKHKQYKNLECPGAADVDNNDNNGKTSLREILTPQVVGLLLNNTIMCFVSEVLFALFPLFSFTPISSGGMGLNEAAIGLQMSARAVLHVGLMFFYSNLERHFKSTTRLYRVTMFTWPVAVCFMPALNMLARIFGANSPQVNLVMLVFYIIWGFCGFAWTSATIMVTDASPSERALSTINGLSQMAIILPQAVAPATATALFAYSIESQIAGGHLIWIVLFCITCGGAVHSLSLKETTHDWRVKRNPD